MKISWLLIALLASTGTVLADVRVEGDVDTPQHYAYKPGLRLNDVLAPAAVSLRAYHYGASWLHTPAIDAQRRLKIGVLFDLEQLRQAAVDQQRTELATLATDLHGWVDTLPVTGRRIARLDPLLAELHSANNLEVADGDRIIYPHLPNTVEVVGAVASACTLPFKPLQLSADYVEQCDTARPLADSEWLYLLQPDGSVQKFGIALWNRTDDTPSPAPGARIYVPLRTLGITPDLNDELAALIATQPLTEDRHD